jgi:glycosyltransferase involved in cell wall biosynthesis
MENATRRFVLGLLAAGLDVTVVARGCELRPHPRLRFARVRTPARPVSIAYPLFFLAASLLTLRHRRGGALVHTTGAIVSNRSDVSTVHYCHRAAHKVVAGSRASRDSAVYRLNAVLTRALSRLGERWCYRPSRTHALCPVSAGVAAELREHFPAMADRVIEVPNGVDADEFRPDAAQRATVRAELGIDSSTPLALFVGGDWERKGLRHVIDALALAPGWHLAVAGAGEEQNARARASEQVAERVHLLGVVSDMPRLYAAADVFVLPTSYEAFALAMLEAAASGLPLLVTRVNGSEELLENGGAGHFVDPDPGDIARHLNELARDPAALRSLGASARDAAARFSWEAADARYLALYDALQRRRQRPRDRIHAE